MFWLIAIGLIVAVGLPMTRALVRRTDAVASAAQQDMTIYKDQLAEVERDLARGVLNPAEAEAARTEVARRLLAADKRAEKEQSAQAAGPKSTLFALGSVGVALLAAVWLYTSIGVPGMPDMPLTDRLAAAKEARENRPNQAAAEAVAAPIPTQADPSHLELVAKLREAVKQNPDDPQGLRLLVDNEARLGNLVAARTAQQHLMQVLGETAKPSDYTDFGEILILAAGGYVSPEAETALVQALNKNPRDPRARYYSGLALAQTGRPDVAYRMWAGLLEEGPPEAPWIPLIQSQIGPVARAAGIPLTASTAPGPTAEQVEGAQDMSPEDRQAMIKSMVSGLADRLATDGGTPVEWARLIRAYGVLGETGNANAIWLEAKETFASNEDAMSILREAARAAEIIN